jgi:hypothetical protein
LYVCEVKTDGTTVNRRLGILVLNAVFDTEAFMRTRDARISILARA